MQTDAHPLFERLSDKELESDPAACLLASATEEGQKVARNSGQVCLNAWIGLLSCLHFWSLKEQKAAGFTMVEEIAICVQTWRSIYRRLPAPEG